jgi:hypothetical protein
MRCIVFHRVSSRYPLHYIPSLCIAFELRCNTLYHVASSFTALHHIAQLRKPKRFIALHHIASSFIVHRVASMCIPLLSITLHRAAPLVSL